MGEFYVEDIGSDHTILLDWTTWRNQYLIIFNPQKRTIIYLSIYLLTCIYTHIQYVHIGFQFELCTWVIYTHTYIFCIYGPYMCLHIYSIYVYVYVHTYRWDYIDISTYICVRNIYINNLWQLLLYACRIDTLFLFANILNGKRTLILSITMNISQYNVRLMCGFKW